MGNRYQAVANLSRNGMNERVSTSRLREVSTKALLRALRGERGCNSGIAPCLPDLSHVEQRERLFDEIIARGPGGRTGRVRLVPHDRAPPALARVFPLPLLVAAAIAAKTTRLRVGSGVLLLPLYHPVRVAEDGAMVDLLSKGRLILGVGASWTRPEAEAVLGRLSDGCGRRQRPRSKAFWGATWSEPIRIHVSSAYAHKQEPCVPGHVRDTAGCRWTMPLQEESTRRTPGPGWTKSSTCYAPHVMGFLAEGLGWRLSLQADPGSDGHRAFPNFGKVKQDRSLWGPRRLHRRSKRCSTRRGYRLVLRFRHPTGKTAHIRAGSCSGHPALRGTGHPHISFEEREAHQDHSLWAIIRGA